ncbi:MAG: hypothetical protein GTN74_06760 [Proteobacteria bacterium]|nr:hypothetical protein [Pseudomonadota bacterium]
MDHDSNQRDQDSEEANETIQEDSPVDLNLLFPEEKTDLNRLFPDSRLRRLLREVRRNRRDVERFLKRLGTEGGVSEKPGGADEVS